MQIIKNVIQRVPARLEKLLKTIGNNTNTFKMKTLSKGKLTSRGAELASGVTNQHLLMRHLSAAHTKILAWVFCTELANICGYWQLCDMHWKSMQLNAKIYVLKVWGAEML